MKKITRIIAAIILRSRRKHRKLNFTGGDIALAGVAGFALGALLSGIIVSSVDKK